jgi:3-hydroxy-9,10-secoandrosta-1,3,5(10)-triene-9,17-dione monooxygenase reductase component
VATSTLLPPVAQAEFRDFMRHWPTGVAIVTTAGPDGPVGCTVSALMSLSLEPPLLLVSFGEDSRTLEVIRRTELFGASVLAAEQGELSERFCHCAPAERFDGLELRVEHGVPLLAGATAQTVCTVQDLHQVADHVLVVGAPVWQAIAADREPLLLHRGEHRRVG